LNSGSSSPDICLLEASGEGNNGSIINLYQSKSMGYLKVVSSKEDRILAISGQGTDKSGFVLTSIK
jgi:hypothetical protein